MEAVTPIYHVSHRQLQIAKGLLTRVVLLGARLQALCMCGAPYNPTRPFLGKVSMYIHVRPEVLLRAVAERLVFAYKNLATLTDAAPA
jgi:hypothetical protein